MMQIFKKLDYSVKYRIEGNLYHVTVKFKENNSQHPLPKRFFMVYENFNPSLGEIKLLKQ